MNRNVYPGDLVYWISGDREYPATVIAFHPNDVNRVRIEYTLDGLIRRPWVMLDELRLHGEEE